MRVTTARLAVIQERPTVSEEAELGFLTPETLDWLLRRHPGLCGQLMSVLGEQRAETQQLGSRVPDEARP